MATHSSTLAWRIPWREETGRLLFHGVAKSRTRLSDFTFTFTFRYLKGQEKPPHIWVGKKKEQMKREIKKGTSNCGRKIKVRRSSHI